MAELPFVYESGWSFFWVQHFLKDRYLGIATQRKTVAARETRYTSIAMKKENIIRHPLAALRKCTTYRTQREFATRVGVKEVTIRKIESCSLPMSATLAERIAHATGVDPATIRTTKNVRPRSLLDGAVYTEHSFKLWSSAYAHDLANDPDTIIENAEVIKEMIEEVLFASVYGKHREFPAVRWAICQAIADISAAFDLETAVASVRRGDGGPENHCSYNERKAKTFGYRMLGRIITPDEKSLPSDTYDDDLDPIFFEGAVGDARLQKQAFERRLALVKELRSYARKIPEPKLRVSKAKTAGLPKK